MFTEGQRVTWNWQQPGGKILAVPAVYDKAWKKRAVITVPALLQGKWIRISRVVNPQRLVARVTSCVELGEV